MQRNACRVCLNSVKEASTIYEKLMNMPIFSHINSITNVNIGENDGLPTKVCPQCVSDLKTAVNFKRKCENSSVILHAALCIKANNVEDKTETEDLKEELLVTDNLKIEEVYDDHNLDNSHSLRVCPDAIDSENDDTDVEDTTEPEDVKEKFVTDYVKTEEVYDDHNLDNSHSFGVWPDVIDSENDDTDTMTPHSTLKSEPVSPETVTEETKESIFEDNALINHASDKLLIKTKYKDLNLQCDDCKNYFRTKCKLRVHWKREHLKEKLTCKTCQKGFNTYLNFKHHMKKPPVSCEEASKFKIELIGKKRIFHCKECNYKSGVLKSIVQHERTHSGVKPFSCDICGSSFTQYSSLDSHKEFIHKVYKQTITCQYCGVIVKGRRHIKLHLWRHTQKNVQCDICKKKLKNKTTLVTHLLTHSGSKTIQCDICAKMFTTKAGLTNHKRIYHFNKRRMYECEICHFKSTRKDYAIKHQSKHNGTNSSCMTCGKFFANEKKVKLHEKKHINNPIVCSICEKIFLKHINLLKHYKIAHNVLTEVKKESEVSELSK